MRRVFQALRLRLGTSESSALTNASTTLFFTFSKSGIVFESVLFFGTQEYRTASKDVWFKEGRIYDKHSNAKVEIFS